MVAYAVRRSLHAVPVLVALSLAAFLLIHLVPGNPVRLMLGYEATPARVKAVETELGLNRPLTDQYLRFLTGVLHGNLGTSIVEEEPVASVIGARIGPTLLLTVMATAIACFVSVALGSIAALHRGRVVDYMVRLLTLLCLTTPAFWLGITLIRLVGVDLGALPISGYGSGFWEHVQHLILPAVTLATVLVGVLARQTRASLIQELDADHVDAANARGLHPGTVFGRYALRNALMPSIATLGILVSSLVAGAIITETVFAIPGIGSLVVSAISQRDYPVVQGLTLLIGAAVVVVNLVIDFLYAAADPRVRLSR
jgi:peptide/nickel transport system permease protein